MDRLSQLMAFLKFSSISAQSVHASDVSECADWLVDKLTSMGFDVKKHATAGHPIVTACGPQAEGKPTVLIYGHYDVQPVDPVNEWISDPFEPEVRDGRVYARGATDNKGQLLAHVLGVEELMKQEGGVLPLNVKFVFEGEEEIGSGSLVPFMDEHRDLLACDVIVVSDTGMAAPGVPTLSYGLRGVVNAELIIKGPKVDLHSGIFGGAVPNPATVLARLIASCHNERNEVMVEGFYDGVQPLELWERSMWKTVPGMSNVEIANLVGVDALMCEGDYSAAECIYARPTLEVNGIGGGYQGEGSKTIIPAAAFAKLSFRLVPGQTVEHVLDVVEQHFKKHAPAGVQVIFRKDHGGAAYLTDPNSVYGKAAQEALEESFGSKPVLVREGGSIPIIKAFQDVLGVESLLLGMCLPDAAIHSPNENIRIDVFNQGVEMNQCLMRRLAQIIR